MNASTLQSFHLWNDRGPVKRGICPSRGVGCAVVRNNEFHDRNLEWFAIRPTRRLDAISRAAQISLAQVEVIEAIHEKFLNRERLAHIFRHLYNPQPASWNDCTAFVGRKMNLIARCGDGSLRETLVSLSKVFAFLFLSLKINHLRRLPPDQVL